MLPPHGAGGCRRANARRAARGDTDRVQRPRPVPGLGCDRRRRIALRLVDFYHGPVDAAVVARVHDGGAFAGWQTGDVDEARAAADAGCDVLVVRGTEGGGRMYGGRSLWPLLAEVLDAVDVPVLAAGGIASGRLLAAALAAGADGVRLGTRFVATLESGAHDAYKQALVTAPGDGTVLTEAYATMWPDTVRTARVLRRASQPRKQPSRIPWGS